MQQPYQLAGDSGSSHTVSSLDDPSQSSSGTCLDRPSNQPVAGEALGG
jgi:hypothetical protein